MFVMTRKLPPARSHRVCLRVALINVGAPALVSKCSRQAASSSRARASLSRPSPASMTASRGCESKRADASSRSSSKVFGLISWASSISRQQCIRVTSRWLTQRSRGYAGDAAAIGKHVGDDLREGKPTLPLMYLMENGTPEQRELVRNCIEQGDEQHFEAILAAITTSGALDFTRREAEVAAQRAASAIAGLPESELKQSLQQLCVFAVDRNH
jgi:hypothetical protein